ncbi:hypothetical protein FRC14_000060 [Serendipita sp. 396]|nr:hypothetical protein FRC14_000060 [Serendipita sp. 396]KAG8789859.1 hypothetical protein FRC15_000051 [Serendipita sp. 397]KAG8814454.1 hypothetical protein FRC19_001738 [Serendipita sp. 401]KAG8879469.1 hypothetical protein FRC20_000041 [Serendipita sp. 405]KAG9042035.1 hypothetical protein FS842_002368 [Serendipita sp. 407]
MGGHPKGITCYITRLRDPKLDLTYSFTHIIPIRMALSLYLETLANKWLPTRWSLPEAVVDLTGRTVIVTGGNTGLGLEAAKMFYAMNPERLILAVRTVGKGEEAKCVLEAGSTSNASASSNASAQSKPRVDVWELDMASFESVKTFANKCKTELKRIDIFLANAGVNSLDWTTTGDGWEVRRAAFVSRNIVISIVTHGLRPQFTDQCSIHIPTCDIGYTYPRRYRQTPRSETRGRFETSLGDRSQ